MYLIAEVSPGAKPGSDKRPHGRAKLHAAGSGRPAAAQTHAEAYRRPAAPQLDDAVEKLSAQIAAFDRAYKTEEKRICLNLSGATLDETPTGSLKDLAAWAEAQVKGTGLV